jgi:2-oxoisovalerate dehydrogenase E2 component (dihydrolipoyl transacylase)
MGQYVVKLPDIGEGGTEAEIVAWHVKVGDTIREEDPLVDVMTDKATVEIPAPVTGTIVALNGAVGEKRPVGSELVTLEVAGEGNVSVSSRPAEAGARPLSPLTPTLSPQAGRGSRGNAEAGKGNSGVGVQPRTQQREEAAASSLPSPATRERGDRSLERPVGEGMSATNVTPHFRRPGEKPLGSPAVRKRAWDLGIELRFVPGTGPGGRITHEDLDAFAEGRMQPIGAQTLGLSRRDGVEDVPITGLRRAIAERLQEAKRRIPHFSYVEECDVTALEELREHLNASSGTPPRLTLLPFLMRAIVRTVEEHPQVNSRFDDDAGVLHRHRAVHIGIATQTDGGLMVPVAHHAEALDLWQAAAEVTRLAEAARAGKASRQELTGSTITITSLGRLGGIASTPVINYPEVAIVGVNRIVERPVVRPLGLGGAVVVRKMMNLSSSFDHRIVDGWEAASFIQRIRAYLEQPATLFI